MNLLTRAIAYIWISTSPPTWNSWQLRWWIFPHICTSRMGAKCLMRSLTFERGGDNQFTLSGLLCWLDSEIELLLLDIPSWTAVSCLSTFFFWIDSIYSPSTDMDSLDWELVGSSDKLIFLSSTLTLETSFSR